MRNELKKILKYSKKYSKQKLTKIPQKSMLKNIVEQKNFDYSAENKSNEQPIKDVSQCKKKINYELKQFKLLTQWKQNSKLKLKPHFYTQDQQQPIFISIKAHNVQKKIPCFKKKLSTFLKKGLVFPLRAKTFRKDSQESSPSLMKKEKFYTSRQQEDYITPLIHRFQTNHSEISYKFNTSTIENQERIQLQSDLNNQSIKNASQMNKPFTLRQQRIKRKNMIAKNKKRFSIKTLEAAEKSSQPKSSPLFQRKGISLQGTSKKMSLHVCEDSSDKYSPIGLIIFGKKRKEKELLANK